MNNITIHGRLTADPVKRTTTSDKTVVNFSLADNYGKAEPIFWDCEAWGNQALTLSEHCRKGDQLIISGQIRNESWEKDGIKKYKLKVNVTAFGFVGGKDKSALPDTEYKPLPEIDLDDVGKMMPF